MNIYKLIIAAAVPFIMSTQAYPADTGNPQKGTSTAVFLKMIPGARPAAMGNAFTGISNDINAIYTNASGLADLIYSEVSATHIKWLEDINNTYVSAAYPFNKNTIGIGINYLSMGDIEMRDDTGSLLSDKSSVYNANVSMVYARKISSVFMIGLTAKNIIQRLGTYDGNGYAFDVSALSKFGKFSTGLSIQNIGSPIKIANVDNNLPFLTRLGAGWAPIDKKLLIGFDLEMPRDDDYKIHLGAEYIIQDQLAVRAGYNQINGGLNKLGTDGKNGGFALGLGSRTFLGRKAIYGSEETDTENLTELIFDYAISQFSEDLGFTHRFTISLKFK